MNPVARRMIFSLALGAALLQLATSASAVSPASDRAQIRAARAASNAALAAHDLTGATAALLPEARIIGSNGSLLDGRDAMQAAFARSFADPAFVRYVRQPRTIEIGIGSAGVAVATESGRWQAHWRIAGAAVVVDGPYLAHWKKVDGAWRIASETFIRLRCTGGSGCLRF
jgi:ketosteroid isomerase-like protein